jgi:hypothetical protein
MALEDAFSDHAIIRELCRARIKLASSRREALFFHNICEGSKSAHAVLAQHWGEIPEGIFPSRRLWHRFRRKRGRTRSSEATNLEALERAVHHYRASNPDDVWVIALNSVILDIRSSALSPEFSFAPPQVVLKVKDKVKQTYRALTIFRLKDKVIDCLVARYLRQFVDHALPNSCLAFRCCRPMPSIHSALDRILDARARWQGAPIFVAECDIRGFFDCVSHRIAEETLANLITEAQNLRPHDVVDPQAVRVFNAYLNAYSFADSVRDSEAVRKIRVEGIDEPVPWHEKELQEMHGSKSLPPIGVPQGGALSCLVANAVLFAADKMLEAARRGSDFLYMRYCDDMVLLSPDRQVTTELFDSYVETLKMLLLPVHHAKEIDRYDTPESRRSLWTNAKSKRPYRWASDPRESVPWIQFVGYQIRWDGVIRIRPSSLRKEQDKIVKAGKDLLAALHRAKGQGIRRSRQQILHRFRQKLISMAVGRARISDVPQATLPMCWTNGFRGVVSKSAILAGLKHLDRRREHEIRKMRKALKRFRTSKPLETEHPKIHRFYGRPFSYCGRFLP